MDLISYSVPLSKSLHRIRGAQNPVIKTYETQLQKLKQEKYLCELVQIVIKLTQNDELSPQFIDILTRFLSNNQTFEFDSWFMRIKETSYIQFQQVIKNLRNQMNRSRYLLQPYQKFITSKVQKDSIKKTRSLQNITKYVVNIGSGVGQHKKFVFRFQSCSNSISFLLDVSPYMLLYDYSTSSFCLQNMEEIVKDLFNGLENYWRERAEGEMGPGFFISCYVYSVYHQEIEQVMKDQQVIFSDNHETKFKNRDLICNYICAYINRSRLPHMPIPEQRVPIPISRIIQRVLNIQQSHSGINSIIIISSFKQFDNRPLIFFNSNWYTFCFICAGELNFGSFIIDDMEIDHLISKNCYFQSKFIYRCRFLENWERLELIQKEGVKFRYTDDKVKKGRVILYITKNEERREQIFNEILSFKLRLSGKKKKIENAGKSHESLGSGGHHYHHKGYKNKISINQYQFNVSVQHIADILKTKYLQGWQQLPTENYLQNTRYLFKLQFVNRTSILYKATRTQDHFNVQILNTVGDGNLGADQQKIKVELQELRNIIKEVDLFSTSNFNMGYERNSMVKELLAKHEEWNCYFKVRKIYMHFFPASHFIKNLDGLLNQLEYLLGERISHLCFLQRKKVREKIYDNINEREVSKWNLVFVKISGIFHFLQFKFGFLKFGDAEIKQFVENIEGKLTGKKLVNGWIKMIPEDIYGYCMKYFNSSGIVRRSLPNVFQKSWRIVLKNEYIGTIFRNLNKKILKKLGYNYLCTKSTNVYYYKIIQFTQKSVKKQRGIFLHISYQNKQTFEFKMQTLCSFSKIQDLIEQQQNSELINGKNMYQMMTQKSIPSSGYFSISTNSLPVQSGNLFSSAKEIPSAHKASAYQNQSKYKNSFLELFTIFINELKESQKKLVNLLKSYTEIFQAIVKKRLNEKKSGISHPKLREKIYEIYQFKDDFETEFLISLQCIKKEYYNEQMQPQQTGKTLPKRPTTKTTNNQNTSYSLQVNIDDIPIPTQHLTLESELPISSIKGDFTLGSKTELEKKYTFFLVTPNNVVYLWRNPYNNRIQYRVMPNVYSSTIGETHKAELKEIIEMELICRINRQVKQEQYLAFYNMIAEQLPSSINIIPKVHSQRKLRKDVQEWKKYKKSEQCINEFSVVVLNCNKILNILENEQYKILEKRMKKVIDEFRKKFFQYVAIFYEQCKVQFITDGYRIVQQVLVVDKKQEGQKQVRSQQVLEVVREQKQVVSMKEMIKREVIIERLNNYYYEKKNVDDNQIEVIGILNVEQFSQFDNSVLKIITDNCVAVDDDNFMDLFFKKTNNSERNENQQSIFSQIQILCFGSQTDRISTKLQWLNQILMDLVDECLTYLNISTVVQGKNIDEMDKKLSDCIVRVPPVRIRDDIWSELEIIRQIDGGQMRSIIPFYQYSFKPLLSKFVAREVEILTQGSNNQQKQIYYLQYWLTLEIAPSRCIKMKMIPFRHISLSESIVVTSMPKGNYQTKIHEIVDYYMNELFKYLSLQNVFKVIEYKQVFPVELPLHVNRKIAKKLEEEKKKVLKHRASRRHKNRHMVSLDHEVDKISGLKQQLFEIGSLSLPIMPRIQNWNNRDSFQIPFIYQGEISYYPKLSTQEIFRQLVQYQKLSLNVIRNLENTFLFIHPELKQYCIFYLDKDDDVECQVSQDFFGNLGGAGGFGDGVRKQEMVGQGKRKKKANTIAYYVYCVDSTVDREILQKHPGELMKKAVWQVTFLKIAKHLEMSPSFIDEAEEEYFKKGETWSYSQKIPYIEHSANLRQYLKQHIENGFYHKKTEFKSEVQKMEMMRRVEEEEDNLLQKNRGSNQKGLKGKITYECQKRCNPQTWIFNTVENVKLEQLFGKCVFLLKINITRWCHMAQNAMFWHRSIKQNSVNTYIYPFMSQQHDGNLLVEANNEDNCYNEQLLYSYLASFIETEGSSKKKCSEVGKSEPNQKTFQNKKTLNSLPSSMKLPPLMGNNSKKDLLEIGFPKVQSSVTECQMKENERYSMVTFEIVSYVGHPKFKMLQNVYRQFVFQSLFDYFLQNRLFRELFINYEYYNSAQQNKVGCTLIKQKSMHEMPVQGVLPEVRQSCRRDSRQIQRRATVQMHELSTLKGSNDGKQSITFIQEQEYENKIFLALLQFFYILEKQLNVDKTESVTIYRTVNTLLIESKIAPLFNFISIFIDTFAAVKSMDNYLLRFVVYVIDRNSMVTYFWRMELQRGDLVNKQNRNSKFWGMCNKVEGEINQLDIDILKVGVYFGDFLYDVESLRRGWMKCDGDIIGCQDQKQRYREWSTYVQSQSRLHIDLQWMKKYLQNRSFCQHEYLFKRSLLIHYEILESEFMMYSYNFKEKDIEYLIERLEEMQMWFAQKYRLINFISKIKSDPENQFQYYQIPPPPIPNSLKKCYIDQLKILSNRDIRAVSRQRAHSLHIDIQQIQRNLTRLLKSLVFNQLPINGFIFCRGSIEKMYLILARSNVLYRCYPEYKGKDEKSRLQKIGREYLSILREEYGFEKTIRKESDVCLIYSEKKIRKMSQEFVSKNQEK